MDDLRKSYGEKLFAKIHNLLEAEGLNIDYRGKITGMFLDAYEIVELEELVASEELLIERVNEALQVLGEERLIPQPKKSETNENAARVENKTPEENRTVFLPNVSQEVTDKKLEEIFSRIGKVESVSLFSNNTGRIIFEREDDCVRAIDSLNYIFVGGQSLRLIAESKKTLYYSGENRVKIAHVANEVDEKSLFDTLSVFGEVIIVEKDTTGSVIIVFEQKSTAVTAVSVLNGKSIAGEVIDIKLL